MPININRILKHSAVLILSCYCRYYNAFMYICIFILLVPEERAIDAGELYSKVQLFLPFHPTPKPQ